MEFERQHPKISLRNATRLYKQQSWFGCVLSTYEKILFYPCETIDWVYHFTLAILIVSGLSLNAYRSISYKNEHNVFINFAYYQLEGLILLWFSTELLARALICTKGHGWKIKCAISCNLLADVFVVCSLLIATINYIYIHDYDKS